MSYIANTAFEISVSNVARNNTQNVTGKFGSFSGTTFTADICSAGFLTVENSLLPNEGYGSSYLNGNAWYMVAASNGAADSLGDHTGIYACNNHDVNKATNTEGNSWNLGAQTLGLPLIANALGDFTEIIIGEQYTFGAGNFSTLASSTDLYVTISNGLLVGSSSAPNTGSGVYFKYLRSKNITQGATNWGTGYVVKACIA